MSSCKNGCEYTPIFKHSIRQVTPEQRLTALAYCYEARDLCIREHRETEARAWQKEINRIESVKEALERRVKFLEERLQQRFIATVNEYQDRRKYFDKMQEYVLTLFLDLPPDAGLTRTEIPEEFKRKYPHMASVDALRRAYELKQQDKLWTKQDPDGTVRFFLKLKEVEEVNVQ
jgi:hypothetical protein